jgi:hypothetical protein
LASPLQEIVMPKKISKNKNQVTITEYQVSEIDIDGEMSQEASKRRMKQSNWRNEL